MKNNDIRKVKAEISKKAVRYAQQAIGYIAPWDMGYNDYTWETQLETVLHDILIERSVCTLEMLESHEDEKAITLALNLERLNYEIDRENERRAKEHEKGL